MNYTTANSRGWIEASDKLFMAQFQGKPCEICQETSVQWGGRQVTTMGHHLLTKAHHKAHRYNLKNIIVLCMEHHKGQQCSPHADDSAGLHAFYEFISIHSWSGFISRYRHDRPARSFSYRDAFLAMGGTVDQTQKKKDWKPTNLAQDVRRIKSENLAVEYVPS